MSQRRSWPPPPDGSDPPPQQIDPQHAEAEYEQHVPKILPYAGAVIVVLALLSLFGRVFLIR